MRGKGIHKTNGRRNTRTLEGVGIEYLVERNMCTLMGDTPSRSGNLVTSNRVTMFFDS